jgi:protein-S-isoprenylcysteine O-methyltransferase Ste14
LYPDAEEKSSISAVLGDCRRDCPCRLQRREIQTMTDVKLAEATGPRGEQSAESAVNPWLDWAARAAIVMVFAALAFIGLSGIPQLLPLDSIHKLLMVAARIASVMFLTLIASTTLTRLAPILKSRGIEPRISALLGTFMSMGLALLPKADLGPILSVTSTVLIMTGATLSFVVLRWLGKSFSILAEARRLVTEGPYRVVRHPLYVCEGIAIAGVMLQVISPWAVSIAIAIAVVQYRRMVNEEAILNSAFPEYRAYAARTPRVAPAFFAGSHSGSNPVMDDSRAP